MLWSGGRNQDTIYEFPEQKLLDTKTYDTSCMKLTGKKVLEDGVVQLEIAYQEVAGEEGAQEPSVTNRQVLRLRVMEQGLRLLSYSVIDPDHEPEANRLLEDFAWKQWNVIMPCQYTYEDGAEEPKTESVSLSSNYDAARECIQNITLGKTISGDRILESGKLTASLSIEAESGGQKRVYNLKNLEADGREYLYLQSFNTDVVVGDSGNGVSVSFDGIPITQAITKQSEILCEYSDSQLFKDMVRELLAQAKQTD